MDEFLNPQAEAEGMAVDQQQGEPQDEPQDDQSAPAAHHQNESHVPLAALEAERKGRQDWKEKAIRYEEELRHMREQAANPPQERQQLDPLQSIQQQLINERFNTSEMLVKQAHADADEVVGVFMEAAKANPALSAALQSQRHPWDFAYKEGKRLSMLKEVGDDPSAYRAKIEAEVMAKLNQSQPQALNLPTSLNGARSVANRSSPAFTGPTPLDAIVNQRN